MQCDFIGLKLHIIDLLNWVKNINPLKEKDDYNKMDLHNW